MQIVGDGCPPVPVAICLIIISVGAARAQENAEHALQIDIPKANVVIDYGHAAFNGDLPFALADIGFLATDFRDLNTKGQIIVTFHGDAA